MDYILVASNGVNPFYISKFTHLHTCTTLHIRLQMCQTLTNEAKEQKLDEKRNKFLSEKFFPSGIETDWATHIIAHISVWVVVGLSFPYFLFFVCEKMCLNGPGSSNLFESQLVNLKTSFHFTGLKQIFVHIFTAKLKNKFLVPLDITRPQTRIIRSCSSFLYSPIHSHHHCFMPRYAQQISAPNCLSPIHILTHGCCMVLT